MKIIVTGATGFIGQQLIPVLRKKNVDVVAIGRNVEQLRIMFPDTIVGDYEDVPTLGRGADILLHLAVANNNQNLSEAEFRATNVGLVLKMAATAKDANVATFINVSSTHVLDTGKRDFYSMTKREAIAALSDVKGLSIHTLILPMVYGDKFSGALDFLNKLPAVVSRLLLPIFAALKPTVSVEKIADWLCDSPVSKLQKTTILANDMSENLVYGMFKKVIDILFVLFVFSVLGGLLFAVWIAVKLSSKGPGLFSQPRIGKGGAVFTCRKFRTMRPDTAQVGTHEVSEGAVTNLGNYLRKLKLDELPQAWNVLRGDLSLIGPRPCLPVQEVLIDERGKRGVFTIRPGISGLAQVKGVDMSDPVTLAELDAQYVVLRSIVMDLRLIFGTATGKGFGDHVRDS